MKLGEKRDTGDSEGIVIETSVVDKKYLREENIKSILAHFLGEQEQIPPMYSAIKINGKKLYEYARRGQRIKIEPRKIKIFNIELIDIDKERQEISFKVQCSKGTYIRSLCEDIALKLHTVGFMKELKRTQVGEFSITKSISIQDLEKKFDDEDFLDKYFISTEDILKEKNNISISNKKIRQFLNGIKLKYQLDDGIYKIYNENNEFIGIGNIKNKELKRDIIVNE